MYLILTTLESTVLVSTVASPVPVFAMNQEDRAWSALATLSYWVKAMAHWAVTVEVVLA